MCGENVEWNYDPNPLEYRKIGPTDR